MTRYNRQKSGRNPVRPLSGGEARRQLDAAARRYQSFTGHNGEYEVSRADIKIPRALAVIGVIDAIEYTTIRDGKRELYRHDFRLPSSRKPLFCVSPDGSQIFLVGGDYQFTDAGIEDLK